MYVTPFAVIHDCVIPLTCTYVARQQRIDVVLVDTAGRMQDNEPLMRALAKVLYEHSKSMCHVLVIGSSLLKPPLKPLCSFLPSPLPPPLRSLSGSIPQT